MAKRTLSRVSTAALQSELRRRQQSIATLQGKRDKLAKQLAGIEREIAELGGEIKATTTRRAPARRKPGRPKGSGRGRRPKNKMTLVEAMDKVLKNKTMSVSEIAVAVQKAGYKTSSSTFRTIVNQTLIKSPKRFKKVARGQYTGG